MNDFVFATMAGTSSAAYEALLWARSIRAFAGRYADAPIWLMVPEHVERLPASLRVELNKNNVRLLAFDKGGVDDDFPFAGKTIAAGAAEALAEDHSPFLVWMDRDSLLIREPIPLLMADNKAFGYRPVDHTLIGSRTSEAPGPFWSRIYSFCGVDEGKLRPMVTSVDEQAIRPYFNAGLLVVRPGRELLRTWSETFMRLHQLPAFTVFYDQDFLYRLFLHQAILSGVILAGTVYEERHELTHLVNYPLHMHATYPAARRAARLNDVYSCRYDTLADDPHWERIIPIDDPLRGWLQQERRAAQQI